MPFNDSIPPAPWTLRGEAAAFWAPPFSLRLLVHYTQSPVGAYDEHALGTLTLRGPHVWQMSVNLEASKRGGRAIWGFPKGIERLKWTRSGERIHFEREGGVFRLRAFGPSVPLALPFWTIQFLDERPVRVPGHIRGRLRLGWRGRQLAVLVQGFEMTIEAPVG